MPTYSYKCLKCGVEFEEVQKITDSPLVKHRDRLITGMDTGPSRKCPGKVERLISNTSFQLKGSGWTEKHYNTTTKRAKF